MINDSMVESAIIHSFKIDNKDMQGLAINAMRVGWKYRLVNYGETYEFETLQKLNRDNFLLKDLHTLEHYELRDLVKFGRGKDFEINEM